MGVRNVSDSMLIFRALEEAELCGGGEALE